MKLQYAAIPSKSPNNGQELMKLHVRAQCLATRRQRTINYRGTGIIDTYKIRKHQAELLGCAPAASGMVAIVPSRRGRLVVSART